MASDVHFVALSSSFIKRSINFMFNLIGLPDATVTDCSSPRGQTGLNVFVKIT